MKLTQRHPQRRAFLTGAGSGLGLALARHLAKEGWHLALTDRDASALQAAETELRVDAGSCQSWILDVTDFQRFTEVAQEVVTALGGIDLVINNAGIAVAGALEEVTPEQWDVAIDVNLRGVVHGCQAFVGHLRQSNGGCIINIASAAAFSAGPFMAPYNVTKAAVLALSETLYSELMDDGIHVSVAMPTFFQTNIGASQKSSPELQQLTMALLRKSKSNAEEVALQILERSARGQLHILFPRHAWQIWQFKRFFPKSYFRNMRKMKRQVESFLERAKKRETKKRED